MRADCKCVYLLLVCLVLAYGLEYNVDMERTDICTLSQPQVVNQFDVFYIYANPPQDGKGTRDRCTVKFVGANGLKFKLYIRDLIFRECQIFIKMYDGDMNLNTPRYQFGCNDAAGGSYVSYSSEIAISLEKPDASSTGYKFYLILKPDDGTQGEVAAAKEPVATGTIVGIGVAVFLVMAVVIAIAVYLVVMYRRRKEEKQTEIEMSRSRSTLFLSTADNTRGGSSVHSSVHSSHHSNHVTKDNNAFIYPAFRTKQSISEKAAKCNSIDTLTTSEDRESVSTANEKPAVKDVRREFDSMRRGLLKETHKEKKEKQNLKEQELRRQEAREYDRQGRDESNRGFGRSNRRRENRLISTDNIKGSLREARTKGRTFNDSHSKSHRDAGLGSTRSSRSKSRTHSPARSAHSAYDYRDEVDYQSDDSRHSRHRTRSGTSRSKPRSTSASSQSRSRRDKYEERDDESDYGDRRRHRSRDRHDDDRGYDDDRRSRRDTSSHRSGTQRSRSQSAGRYNRS